MLARAIFREGDRFMINKQYKNNLILIHFFGTYIVVHFVESKGSYMKVCQLFFFLNANTNLMLGRIAVHFILVLWCWPILYAHDFGEVKCFCEHHNTADIFLPHHAPKIMNRLFGWSLSNDISVGLKKTLWADEKNKINWNLRLAFFSSFCLSCGYFIKRKKNILEKPKEENIFYYINIGSINVVWIWNSVNLLQHHPVIIVWNGFLILILLQIVLLRAMSTRIRIDSGLMAN